jgi:hypothetical protein
VKNVLIFLNRSGLSIPPDDPLRLAGGWPNGHPSRSRNTTTPIRSARNAAVGDYR